MKFVLTDHHILILKVLKIFSRIKFIVHSSLKLYSSSKTHVKCDLLRKTFHSLPNWTMNPLCFQDPLYKGALAQVCRNNLLNYYLLDQTVNSQKKLTSSSLLPSQYLIQRRAHCRNSTNVELNSTNNLSSSFRQKPNRSLVISKTKELTIIFH